MIEWIPIIAGPTAVGKTALSLALARRLNAEIVSADSRQIYKGLDIGTAKPSDAELESIPHHFVGELEPGSSYSAGRFQNEAYHRIQQILTRGRHPVVAGGSTLYIHALKHGLADIPEVPPPVRRQLEARMAQEGPEALYEELKRVDPTAAESMDPTKTQRLVRALEVYKATGRPLSTFHTSVDPPPFDFRTFVLNRGRQELYDRINQRVDRMLAAGLLDEVRTLLSKGFDLSAPPLRTIGYQEAILHERGEISYEEMTRRIKRNTRRYAKRQLTWFRRDTENIWLDARLSTSELIELVLKHD